MVIQFHAYRSNRYKEQRCILPTQHYGFWLVEQAIKAGKIIVVTRPRAAWLENVPALRGYGVIELSNVRNPTLSPGNIKVWQDQTKAKFIAEHGEEELQRRRREVWTKLVAALRN